MPGVIKGINYSDPLTRYHGEVVISISKKLLRSKAKELNDINLAVDVFYTFYLPYPILKKPSEIPLELERNLHIIRSLTNSNELDKIRRYTIAYTTMSTLVSAVFIDNLIKELKQEGIEDDEGESGNSRDAQALNNALRRAITKTSNEAEYVKKLNKIVDKGVEAGKGSRMDLVEDGAEVIKLARSANIIKLLDYLSLMPEIGRRIKKKFDRFSKGEFRGYEIGNSLERVVPTELVLPKSYFRLKYLESKLLLYEKVLPMIEGPVYVLTDKSGSMDGDKIKWAKATALALLMKSRNERREFYMRFFDSTPHSLIKISKSFRTGEILKLINYISKIGGSGGTDISNAIITACNDIKSGRVKGTSDIVIITDGEDNISDQSILRKLKASNSRLISVMISGENRDLERISEVYLRAVKLSKDEILKVVEA